MLNKNDRQPLVEDGIVVGTGAKYRSRNPLKQYLIGKFDEVVARLAERVAPDTILEVGCGEGHIAKILLERTGATIRCMDISDAILDLARADCVSPRVSFTRRSIYDLSPSGDSARLVVCCEVLEHLHDPALGLSRLAAIASPYCLMSVPHEPMFRLLNFLRGANIFDFGNDPGHVQHWTRRAFLEFVGTEFEIVETRSPLPWTVVLGKSRHAL